MTASLFALTHETFRSLRARNFRLWFAGQSISMAGFWVQLVAQALLVLRLTDSGTVLGLAAAMQFLPILVVGSWAGVLSDRLDKRRLLIATQATMMATALTLGVVELTGHTTLPLVFVLAALTGTAFAFDQPARRTIVTELVEDAHAANAVSLNGAIGNVAKIVGPAVAGILISTIGIGWCFVLNGMTSVAVLLALACMDVTKIRRPPILARKRGQIREGYVYVWGDLDVRRPLLMLAPVAVVGFNWNVLLPLFVTRDLGGDEATYGLLMGVMSVGSVTGTLWLARRPASDNRFLAVSCTTFGLASLLLAVAPTLATAGVASVAVGATAMVLFNGSVVGMQLGADPALRGRVMAIFSMVFVGSHALGGPVSGGIAERFGARSAIGIGAIAAIAVGLSVLAALRRQNRYGRTATALGPQLGQLDHNPLAGPSRSLDGPAAPAHLVAPPRNSRTQSNQPRTSDFGEHVCVDLGERLSDSSERFTPSDEARLRGA